MTFDIYPPFQLAVGIMKLTTRLSFDKLRNTFPLAVTVLAAKRSHDGRRVHCGNTRKKSIRTVRLLLKHITGVCYT
jgi:hypothetical protein